MKHHPITASLCLLALAFPATAAETFIMKDGSKLLGKIVSEDATTYHLEVEFSKTIKDERIIAKADVVKIEHNIPEQNDFSAISGLTPVPDFQTAEDYAKQIRIVEKYIAGHRMTAKSKDAEAILSTLKAEANEILAGGIKLNGRIIPPVEYRNNAYDFDARIQELKIRKLVKESKILPALRVFSEFQNDFRNTSAFIDLAPLMHRVITAYLAEAGSSLSTYETRVKERKTGLDRMTAADRRNTETAIREENAELEKRLRSEKDAKLAWVTLHPFCKPALDDTITCGKQELSRLASVKSAPFVDGGKIFRDAMSLIQGKGDDANAKTAITAAIAAAKTAMVAPRYIATLEASVPGDNTPPNR